LFPVAADLEALGHVAMLGDMLGAMDAGREPMETFYDGYVVNAIMDAAYQSVETKRWEAILLDDWRGSA
jgi:hypothetical protein